MYFMKLLIVSNQMNTQHVFGAKGMNTCYQIDIVSSGAEALKKLETLTPDLVVLEKQLSDMDEIYLMQLLKEKMPDVPVVITNLFDTIDDFTSLVPDAQLLQLMNLSAIKKNIRNFIELRDDMNVPAVSMD